MAQLSSYKRDSMAHKVKNTHYSDICIKTHIHTGNSQFSEKDIKNKHQIICEKLWKDLNNY